MIQMVGAFAEFERAMLRERTKAGLDATREEGASADAGQNSPIMGRIRRSLLWHLRTSSRECGFVPKGMMSPRLQRRV
jgi:hypothetical protein